MKTLFLSFLALGFLASCESVGGGNSSPSTVTVKTEEKETIVRHYPTEGLVQTQTTTY